MIEALVIVAAIGAILGLLLGIADRYLQVEVDERVAQVYEMLPHFNCGACGYPGCQGMAEGLVNGEAKTVSLCKPSKAEQRTRIKEYLDNTPGPNGEIVHVEI